MIEEDLEQHRDDLVRAMLEHVPLDGWAWPALEAGAKDLGKEAGYARRAFVRRPLLDRMGRKITNCNPGSKDGRSLESR